MPDNSEPGQPDEQVQMMRQFVDQLLETGRPSPVPVNRDLSQMDTLQDVARDLITAVLLWLDQRGVRDMAQVLALATSAYLDEIDARIDAEGEL
jgi:hypothetical protein